MKTAVVAALASVGVASAFAPASTFNGAAVAAPARTTVGPVMFFGGSKKKAAEPAPVEPAPAKKSPLKPSLPFGKKAAPAAPAAPTKPAPAARGAPARAAPSKPTLRPTPPAPVAVGDFPVEFGSDVEAPFWDPLKLAADKPAETLEWYRAAELKHGRVAMLAALGTFVNAAGIALPDDVFQGTTKSFDALAKVAAERPGALIQIVLAISAVEALSVQLPEGDFPGDLGFDPAKQRPVYEGKGEFDALRLRELKNGRLAMIGIAGMWAQEALTGQGVFEQLITGHISPVGDGQGYF